jgi:hypothetical protein
MKKEILKLKAKGLRPFEIAKLLGCCQSTVIYHCNPDYHLRHTNRHKARRHKIKDEAIEYKGGKCEICGYNHCKEALDFHHKDPTQKDPNIKGALTRLSLSIEELKPELDKCILVCCRCHREIHVGLVTVK